MQQNIPRNEDGSIKWLPKTKILATYQCNRCGEVVHDTNSSIGSYKYNMKHEFAGCGGTYVQACPNT